MSYYCIPFDIKKKIIKRVSNFKSLIRFRSVFKPWKSFIESYEFIKSYGAHNTQPHSHILSYIESYYASEVKYICFVDDDDDHNNETLFKDALSLVVSPLVKKRLLLMKKLLARVMDSNLLVIWNPSIRKSFGIVVPDDISKPIFGFGVCPVNRDPTVVKLAYPKDDMFWHVEVFTLSSGDWNVISSSNSPRKSIKFNKSSQVVIDRFIYWGAYEVTYADDGEFTLNRIVVSFDLITKEFQVLDLPDSLTNELYGPFIVSVCKLRKSVVYGDILVDEGRCCGVWVMEHDSSFRKLFTIGANVDKILGFRKSGEPLFEARANYRQPTTLDVYDPCSQQIKNLGIGVERSFFMGSYKESLLLLDQSDSQIYPVNN